VHGDDFHVHPPSFRFDLSIEADLVEEVARLYGYDNIPAKAPRAELTMLPSCETQHSVVQIQKMLASRDYQEIVSYAFLDEQMDRELCGNDKPVRLQNPIASNMAVMRSSLIAGLVEGLRYNLNGNQQRVRSFEVGACFVKTGDAYLQTQKVSAIAYGDQLSEQWGATSKIVDFYDVKADIESLFNNLDVRFVSAVHPALHPGRSATICIDEKIMGWVGELHPQWQQQYEMPHSAVWFEIELDALLLGHLPSATAIVKNLPIRRDIAVLVDEKVEVQTLLDAMWNTSSAYIMDIKLFDVYRGKGLEEGKKSLAFRVLLQDTQRALSDLEIEPSIVKLVNAMRECGAQLRM